MKNNIEQHNQPECNLFNNFNEPRSSGLKPPRNFLHSVPSSSFSRATKSTESRQEKSENNRSKMSLKRGKPKTPNYVKGGLEPEIIPLLNRSKNSLDQTYNHEKFLGKFNTLTQESSPVRLEPIKNEVSHEIKPCLDLRSHHMARFQAIRQNQELMKINFNIIQSSKLNLIIPREEFKKDYPISNKNPERNFYVHEPLSYRSEHRINEPISVNWENNQRFEPSSLKFIASERTKIIHDPLESVFIKESESFVDDGEIAEDERSEVVGRGWNQSKAESFLEEMGDRAKTETHATMASNAKNSSLFFSKTGINENLILKK